jgi:beta-phosphoglucomutase family hydrolase
MGKSPLIYKLFYYNPVHSYNTCLCRKTHGSSSVVDKMQDAYPVLTRDQFDAVLFDLDGVLTATAKVHAACWKRVFDAFLVERAKAAGKQFEPFRIDPDYYLHVDGKPRYDGVRDFLSSRGIWLPEGSREDPPGHDTVCALGNGKDELVAEMMESEGVDAYEDAVLLVRRLRQLGIKTGVVSSSRHCARALEAAGIAELFEVRVDGQVIQELGLPGKPAPDSFLEAARRLQTPPHRTAVVEDAISGIKAGRAGHFALVIGVSRKNDAAALMESGAHVVLTDLRDLMP